jgi:hypothetical protein
MLTLKRLIALTCLPWILTGCHTITNLTPAQLPRNTNGVYAVEVKFDHREQALRKETVKPFVMIGHDFHAMDRTRLMKNRWEALIPVPADQNMVYYRFKFEYEVNAIPEPKKDSKLSGTYKLTIIDK